MDPPDRLVHDLRSPLAVVELLAGVLEQDEGALTLEQRRDYVQRIRRATGEMRALLDAVPAPD